MTRGMYLYLYGYGVRVLENSLMCTLCMVLYIVSLKFASHENSSSRHVRQICAWHFTSPQKIICKICSTLHRRGPSSPSSKGGRQQSRETSSKEAPQIPSPDRTQLPGCDCDRELPSTPQFLTPSVEGGIGHLPPDWRGIGRHYGRTDGPTGPGS